MGTGHYQHPPIQSVPQDHVVQWIALIKNAFPAKGGITDVYSPRQIILTGQKLGYKDLRVDFGGYYEVHDEPTPLNSMKSRTRPCIALGQKANLHGGYKFLDNNTEKVLVKRSFTELSMPEDPRVGHAVLCNPGRLWE